MRLSANFPIWFKGISGMAANVVAMCGGSALINLCRTMSSPTPIREAKLVRSWRKIDGLPTR